MYYLYIYYILYTCIYLYVKQKTLKSGKKEVGQLGTLGLEGPHSGVFPWFSFCLIYPRPETREACNLEMPIGTDKKMSQQKPTLSNQKTRERAALQDRKHLDNNLSTPAKHHRENCVPTHASKGEVGA